MMDLNKEVLKRLFGDEHSDLLKRLCNGTWLRVVKIRRRVLKCRLMSRDRKIIFIGMITLAPGAEDLPIPLQQ